jgi:hypothetical protein
MNDKQFNNKISLWIKQRLFISQKYDDTMNALEKFVLDMQKSEEISLLENQQIENKLTEDEQRRISLVLPPLIGEYEKSFMFK